MENQNSQAFINPSEVLKWQVIELMLPYIERSQYPNFAELFVEGHDVWENFLSSDNQGEPQLDRKKVL